MPGRATLRQGSDEDRHAAAGRSHGWTSWYRFDETGTTVHHRSASARAAACSRRAIATGSPACNTAGFVSGYRGSPLGGLDRELWRAGKYLDAADIRFQPGLNEDLAATSIWGTQQTNLFAGARYDGVFSLWYGKGPGVDRSGDAFKHGNAAGTSRYGGVLVGRGRRSHLQVVVAAAPERVQLHRRDDPGAQPGRRERDRRARPLWLRAVALQRLLDRPQGHAGNRRRDADRSRCCRRSCRS